MNKSQEVDKVGDALALARAEFKPVIKNKINPHFKNKYADLSSIFDATTDALSKHGLAFTQSPLVNEAGFAVVTTMLIHKSGQWLSSELALKPTGNTPQAVGSAITYGRRYSAQAILGIDAEEDDDGALASASNGKIQSAPPPKQQPQQATPKVPVFSKTQKEWMDILTTQLQKKGLDPLTCGLQWYADKLHEQEMKPGILDKLIEEKKKEDEVEIPF